MSLYECVLIARNDVTQQQVEGIVDGITSQLETDGGTMVAAMDPEPVLALVGNPALEPVAREVRARLERVVEKATSAG